MEREREREPIHIPLLILLQAQCTDQISTVTEIGKRTEPLPSPLNTTRHSQSRMQARHHCLHSSSIIRHVYYNIRMCCWEDRYTVEGRSSRYVKTAHLMIWAVNDFTSGGKSH